MDREQWEYELNMREKRVTTDREQYEKDLKQRQEEHLKNVYNRKGEWRPCLHDGCQNCHGTGIKLDGSRCVHMISCSCPKCSPHMMDAFQSDSKFVWSTKTN